MIASVSLLVLGSVLYSVYARVTALHANIERVKQSGLPYYISRMPLIPFPVSDQFRFGAGKY